MRGPILNGRTLAQLQGQDRRILMAAFRLPDILGTIDAVTYQGRVYLHSGHLADGTQVYREVWAWELEQVAP